MGLQWSTMDSYILTFNRGVQKLTGSPGGGGGGTPLYELYGDVPLDRVWFSASLS